MILDKIVQKTYRVRMSINTAPHIHEYVVCANMLVKKHDTYLVIKRSPLKKYAPGFTAFIGGKVDVGENPYEAAVRELVEEAGVCVKNIRLEAVILEIQPVKNEPYNWLVFHFSGDYESGEILSTEEGELVWLTADEIKTSQLFPSVGRVIQHILDREAGTVFATFGYAGHEAGVETRNISVCAS